MRRSTSSASNAACSAATGRSARVAGSYERVVDALRECLKDLSQPELDRIFGENAIEAYRLPGFAGGPAGG